MVLSTFHHQETVPDIIVVSRVEAAWQRAAAWLSLEVRELEVHIYLVCIAALCTRLKERHIADGTQGNRRETSKLL